jgi:hypothetical protein
MVSFIIGLLVGMIVLLFVIGMCRTASMSDVEIENNELKEMLKNIRGDIELMLTLLPSMSNRIVDNLNPTSYITGTYIGDVELQKYLKQLLQRY